MARSIDYFSPFNLCNSPLQHKCVSGLLSLLILLSPIPQQPENMLYSEFNTRTMVVPGPATCMQYDEMLAPFQSDSSIISIATTFDFLDDAALFGTSGLTGGEVSRGD